MMANRLSKYSRLGLLITLAASAFGSTVDLSMSSTGTRLAVATQQDPLAHPAFPESFFPYSLQGLFSATVSLSYDSNAVVRSVVNGMTTYSAPVTLASLTGSDSGSVQIHYFHIYSDAYVLAPLTLYSEQTSTGSQIRVGFGSYPFDLFSNEVIFSTGSLVDLSSHSALSVLGSNSDSILLYADGKDLGTYNAALNLGATSWSMNMGAALPTTPTPTPEPTTAAMTALSLIGSGLVFRRGFKF